MYERGLPRSFIPKKRLGQNFLVDKKSLENILRFAEISLSDTILEVGAGLGTLTQLLQSKARKVIAVEKDPQLADFLQKRYHRNPRVEVVKADILKMELPSCDKVVATPPYNISSKLLFLLLNKQIRMMVLVFQKEFAERLVAEPGTRDYSRLTVMTAHRAHAEILGYIPKESFRPRPKVDSAIVKITPKEPNHMINEEMFADLVRGLFTQRRRNLRTVLRHYIQRRIQTPPEDLLNSDIPSKRVYQMSVDEFERLTYLLMSQDKG